MVSCSKLGLSASILSLVFCSTQVSANANVPESFLKPIQVGETIALEQTVAAYAKDHSKHTVHFPNASFIKLHFSDVNLAEGETIEIASKDGTESYRYDNTKGKDFWAMSVMGDTVNVTLHSTATSSHSQFRIQEYTRGFNQTEQESKVDTFSTCGQNERYNVVCYKDSNPTEYKLSHAVAKLLLNHGRSACTAWRVGPGDKMLTNQHCISSQSDVNAAEVWFNYERPECQSNNPVDNKLITKVEPKKLLSYDYTFDYALFTVPQTAAVSSFGYLELDPRKAVSHEEIFIPQHGSGYPKQFGIESDKNPSGKCEIDSTSEYGRAPGSDLGYYCDTIGGSSGSPVLDRKNLKVIALHHYGGCLNQGVKIENVWPKIKQYF